MVPHPFGDSSPSSPFRGRIPRVRAGTMCVPAPPSYPRHCAARLRQSQAGFALSGSICAVQPVNVWDYERLAAERLDENALAYYAGGAGDEWMLRRNVEAFREWELRPRVLCDVSEVTTATTVLGTEVSMPVLIAPLAFQRMAHPEGELATARAAGAADTVMCLSSAASRDPAEVAAACIGKRWFQVYVFQNRSLTERLIREAIDGGFSALALTVDTPFLGRRERGRPLGLPLP